MFLPVLQRRNPRLLDAAITLHQSGDLPANTYVIDLDAVRANARSLSVEAARRGLTAYAMTKQVGRNPDLCRALIAGGLDSAVAVDMECARAIVRAGMRLGHLGHLVQIPRAEIVAGIALEPAHLTVFSAEKAAEAAAAAASVGREQPILARIHAEGDEFYPGHEGGFRAADILEVADRIDALEGARFAGITTFPALVFDPATSALRETRNLGTLTRAAAALRAAGRDHIEVNAPGTNSTIALAALADAGVTQVEPGHALTGTTPLHAVHDLAELPAVCYLSEVSHLYDSRAFTFGGGLYVDPVFPPYQVRALVAGRDGSTSEVNATLPPSSAIDYYAQLDVRERPGIVAGDSVVFGFRVQAFVTRAYTAGIAGLDVGRPAVAGIWSADGSPTIWPS